MLLKKHLSMIRSLDNGQTESGRSVMTTLTAGPGNRIIFARVLNQYFQSNADPV